MNVTKFDNNGTGAPEGIHFTLRNKISSFVESMKNVSPYSVSREPEVSKVNKNIAKHRTLSHFESFATHHRSLCVILFVIPLSIIYSLVTTLRSYLRKLFTSPLEFHNKRVFEIQQQVLEWKNQRPSERKKICTARCGWESMSPGSRSYKSTSFRISINLNNILEFDAKNKVIMCEPLVTMKEISSFLIPKGFIIPVLPELDDLTVGGVYLGTGIETSSHIFGLFHEMVVEAVVVLSNGERLLCSCKENSDLFEALPWSHGTLGLLVSVKIQVISCKPFVKLKYFPYDCLSVGIERLRAFLSLDSSSIPQFLEGIIYEGNKMVLIIGDFVEAEEMCKEIPVNKLCRWYKPWFYKHVEGFINQNAPVEEYIPVKDYYRRHSKPLFWELEQIIPVGNHPLFRYLLGWALPPKISLLKLTETLAIRQLYESCHVIQDMLVPLDHVLDTLEVFQENYEIYPIWVCPFRLYDYSTPQKEHQFFLKKPAKNVSGKSFAIYVDLGAYGIPGKVKNNKTFDAKVNGRNVENFVRKINGFQMLYAYCYMTKSEFENMFDHTHYRNMKLKYDPLNAFPEVYDKLSRLNHTSNN